MHGDLHIGIIGGTGVGDALRDSFVLGNHNSHFPETPFGQPSAPILSGKVGEVTLSILNRHGDGHVFNPSAVPYRANMFALKSLGCTHIIATGACGSLREEIHPGDIVNCDQLIDKTINRSRTFYEIAAVHVEFAEPFCPVMRNWLQTTAKSINDVKVHDSGCYVCMEGPSFSTRAESNLHRMWGGDVIGMTALPEARLAREAEIAYSLIALPTDYDCWRPSESADQQSVLKEVIANMQRATEASIELIKAALSDVSILHRSPSPAHDALRLAIWSDKTKIDQREIKRLSPLWGTYFDEKLPVKTQ